MNYWDRVFEAYLILQSVGTFQLGFMLGYDYLLERFTRRVDG